MLVKRFLYDQVYDVPTAASGGAFPAGFLWAPGFYVLDGIAYDMTACGVYVFMNPVAKAVNRRAITNTDPLEMCSVFSHLVVHGASDNTLTLSQKDAIAKTSRLRVTCGFLADWAMKWLTSAGFRARRVHFLTADTPNNYDDGHVAVEVFRNGRWVLADLDFGRCFTDPASGSLLSLTDFADRVAALNLGTFALNLESKVDSAPSVDGAFDYAAFFDTKLSTPALVDAWTQRVMRIPGIAHADGNIYFYLPPGAEGRQSWVLGAQGNYRVVSKAAWDAMFYS